MSDYAAIPLTSRWHSSAATPAPSSLSAARADAPPSSPPAFAVFLLINATLFVRPAEIVPSLLGLPIYEALNLLCIVLCAGPLMSQLSRRRLAAAPITACVVGIQVAVVLSHLSHLRFGAAASGAIEFAKVLVYYLLLVTLVDSPQRLRRFLFWMLCFTAVLTALALLNYYGYASIPGMEGAREMYTRSDGGDAGEASEAVELVRLSAVGIFGGPNDLSRVAMVAIFLCLAFMNARRAGPVRLVYVGLMVMFAYALHLTQSRGAFLGFLTGVVVLFYGRYGFRKTLLVSLLVVPVLLSAFGGRQTDLNTSSGTGQQRIQIWSEGLMLFRGSPIFGIGMNRYAEELGLVAHNSFVHCFTELGFVGGTLFVGTFFVALWGLHRQRAAHAAGRDAELARMRPYLLAIIAGFAIGLLSSTRSYAIPTYSLLAIAAVYLNLSGGAARGPAPAAAPAPAPAPLHVNAWLVRRMTAASLAVLLATYVYVRIALRLG
jgi:hypothetical protein